MAEVRFRMWVVVGGKKVGNPDRLHSRLILTATSNSDAALPNVPSDPPHRYGFGKGTDSHTRTRTLLTRDPYPHGFPYPCRSLAGGDIGNEKEEYVT